MKVVAEWISTVMRNTPAYTTENAEWITALSAGRSESIAALRSRLRKGLAAALAGRSDVSDADLDDFTQEALLRVLDRLDTFRGDARFTTWAMAIAVRISLTALRKRRWTPETLDRVLAEFADPSSAYGQADSATDRSELVAVLRAAIAERLTPRQRQVMLAELEGIPQALLAERWSASAGAIYKVSHDARKKLKAALISAGYDAESVGTLLTGTG